MPADRQPVGIQATARALVELTVAEVRRLVCRLLLARRPLRWDDVRSWSVWRRHQATAKRCHYARRGVLLA